MDQQPEHALLEFINSFPVQEAATGPNSLSSGERIWEVLRDVNSYFTGDLPESTEHAKIQWWSRWENLKHIQDRLVSFIKGIEEQGVPKVLPNPDLKAIAMEADPGNSIKLLELVLIAAIHAPDNTDTIKRIMDLSHPTQGVLRELIAEMGNVTEADIDNVEHANGEVSSPASGVDPELQLEERYSQVIAENARLQRERADLQRQLESIEERFDRLHDSNAALKNRLIETEDRLNNGSPQDAKGSSKLLELKIQQQADVITNLEDDLAESRSVKEDMKTSIEKLRDSSTRAQRLQDQLDVVKAERDSLAKKANAAEKYKQKIQAGQDLQKENSELREEIFEVREAYQKSEKARQQVPGLQKAVEDYKRVLEKVEQEHYELQQMKRQLEFDNKALAKRCNEAKHQHARDKDSIAELSDKLHALAGSSPLATPAARENGGLESELTQHGDDEQRLRSQLSEQRKEIRNLRSVEGELKGELDQLQETLSDVRESHAEREKQHLATYEEKLSLQSSLSAVQQGQQLPDTQSYRDLVNKLDEEQRLRPKLESQTKRLKKELETSQQDLSLIDKDKRTVSDEVKKQQTAELTTLREDNRTLAKKLSNVETDLAGARKLLQDTLSKKNPLGDRGFNDEIRKTLNDMKAAVANHPANFAEEYEKNIRALGEKLIQSNEALAKNQEHMEKQNAELHEARASLRQQASPNPQAFPSPQDSPAKTRNKSEVEEKGQGVSSRPRWRV